MMTEPTSPVIADQTAASLSYWAESRRPWPTLLFLLPLILTYEIGLARLDLAAAAVRNGADCWLRIWLLQAGVPYRWALPVVVVGLLLVWQILTGYGWRCSPETLIGMFSESLLAALLLVVVGQALNIGFQTCGFATLDVAAGDALWKPTPAARAISFLGAGIYEELMFRLVLLPIAFYLLRAVLLPRSVSIVLAVALTSVAFAAAHDIPPTAPLSLDRLSQALHDVAHDPSLWYAFSFRVLAGAVFAVLLLLRGFGIAVGCHACYDLLAGILMQHPESLG